MLKQSVSKIKKILTILLAVSCVVSMTAVSVSAAHPCYLHSRFGHAHY